MVEAICDKKDLVLVVDDEEMIGEMIGYIVERHGCQHVSFSDPAEALRHYEANSQKVTLLITNLAIPALSGHDLIRNTHRINPRLPIILITGYTDEHIPEGIRPLVQAILSKPFVKAEVIDAVRTALDKVDHRRLAT